MPGNDGFLPNLGPSGGLFSSRRPLGRHHPQKAWMVRRVLNLAHLWPRASALGGPDSVNFLVEKQVSFYLVKVSLEQRR